MATSISMRLEVPEHVHRPGDVVSGVLHLSGEPDPRVQWAWVALGLGHATAGPDDSAIWVDAVKDWLPGGPQGGPALGAHRFDFRLPELPIVNAPDIEWSVLGFLGGRGVGRTQCQEPVVVAERPEQWAGVAHRPPFVRNPDKRYTLELYPRTRSVRTGDTLEGHVVIRPVVDVTLQSVLVEVGHTRRDPSERWPVRFLNPVARCELAPKLTLRAGQPWSAPFQVEVPTAPPTGTRVKLYGTKPQLALALVDPPWTERTSWFVEATATRWTSATNVRAELHTWV